MYIRPTVRGFKPLTAGLSIAQIREKYGVEQVIKLASNENPLGASPRVSQILKKRAEQAFRYPQAGNPRLTGALGEYLGVDARQIVVGNGSDEVIDLLFRMSAEPGIHNIVAFSPCFGIYTTQAALCGVELRQAPLNDDFSFPWKQMLDLVDEKTSMVMVTSPDNPSGRAATTEELIGLARELPKECLLVVDEAYVDFVTDPTRASLLPRLDEMGNVVLLRTFSKCFGMAGLRLGYGIMPEELAEHFWRIRLPFSVNLLAEEAALEALRDGGFLEATRKVVAEGRAWLAKGLTERGCRVYPSESNFLMFELPQGRDGAQVHEGLLRRGIILRPLTSYGLPRHLRVTIGTAEENRIFLEVLKELV